MTELKTEKLPDRYQYPRIEERIANGEEFFAIVANGKRSGTIARIVDDCYDKVTLKVDGRRPFKLEREQVLLLPDYTGETKFVENPSYAPEVKDFLDRVIRVGLTVVYSRTSGTSCEMILGIVDRITEGGVVMLRPIKIGSKYLEKGEKQYSWSKSEFIQATADRVVIIDDSTLDQMMLLKITHG